MNDHHGTFRASGGERLDQALSRALGISVARARRAILAGGVRVEGRRARKGERLSAGARVAVDWAEEPVLVEQPELPLRIAYEDGALAAVVKPAGWATHPLRPGETGTLANAVAARWPEGALASLAPREAGLCHRLDRETSGLVLVARRREVWLAVRALLSRGAVEKDYLALARGTPPSEGRTEAPIVARGIARPARTSWRTIDRRGDLALLAVRIETGVRWQIRAHLAALGFPLAGDPAFGGGPPPGLLDRHLLHAWKLALVHPVSGERLALAAPLPDDALVCLAELGLHGP